MRLFSLTSDLHGEFCAPASEELFIKDIEAALGEPFEHCGEAVAASDGAAFGAFPDDVLYVRTGGTEGLFKQAWDPAFKAVRIVTSGQSNSLAASMEIVSYLRMKGASGRIIHGSAAQIAVELRGEAQKREVSCLRSVSRKGALSGMRLGVVGRPSDWLISSDVDYPSALRELGVELVDIPMSELISEYEAGGYGLPAGLELNPMNSCRYGKQIGSEDMEKSLRIYGALRRIVDRYGLDGLSLRCFDLLTSVRSTGCLALAILNREGIVATCEGDVPAMLSMAVAKRVCGTPGFQANLSKIANGTALFAHCTVPFDIVENYVYDTHFESGIGVAVHGEFKPGAATVFKIGAGLSSFVAEDVEITGNAYGDNLCRTQILVRGISGADFPMSDYFLSASLGNHHIIIPGAHAEDLAAVL